MLRFRGAGGHQYEGVDQPPPVSLGEVRPAADPSAASAAIRLTASFAAVPAVSP